MSQICTSYVKNANLDTQEVKNMVFKYLREHINEKKIKQEVIASIKDMDNIRDGNYIICPRINGTPSWIIFFRIDHNYYAVNFPKHHIRRQDNIKIYPIEITVDPKFYYGTIMEGIFYFTEYSKHLVIDEIHMIAGENQLLKPKDDRLNYSLDLFKTSVLKMPHYQMDIIQYYDINKGSLQNLYDEIKSNKNIREVIFYPRNYGGKIYSYTIMDIDLKEHVIKIGSFRLQKTASPDVYHLLSIQDSSKIDIAYIPDIDTSKKCKQWFKMYRKKELFVKCHMDLNIHKWIPMEIIEYDLEADKSESEEDIDN